jgi:hypothetical protein
VECADFGGHGYWGKLVGSALIIVIFFKMFKYLLYIKKMRIFASFEK